MAAQMQVRGYFGGKSHSHPRLSYEAETTKESIKTKAEIVSVSVLSKVLSLACVAGGIV